MHVAARWSSGQDEGLSRLNREFDSPTGHHQTCPRRLSAGIGTFFRRPAADTARRGKRANQRIARIAQRASKSTIERVEGTAENSPRTARGTCCKPIQYAYLAQSVEHAAVNCDKAERRRRRIQRGGGSARTRELRESRSGRASRRLSASKGLRRTARVPLGEPVANQFNTPT